MTAWSWRWAERLQSMCSAAMKGGRALYASGWRPRLAAGPTRDEVDEIVSAALQASATPATVS